MSWVVVDQEDNVQGGPWAEFAQAASYIYVTGNSEWYITGSDD